MGVVPAITDSTGKIHMALGGIVTINGNPDPLIVLDGDGL